MLHSEYLLSDEMLADDHWADVSTDLGLWTDSGYEHAEFDVALHNLPTEQELMDMEANREAGKVEDFLIRKERRTALRH